MKLLKENLQYLFSMPVVIESSSAPEGLISLLSRRKMYSIKIAEFDFIGIELEYDSSFTVSALKKQYEKYLNAFHKHCAFIIDNPKRLQIDAFIKNNIPFIAEGNQVYLPFLGVILSANLPETKDVNTEKMMPASQELFLYMFYNSSQKYFLKSEIAEKLNLTRTSMTRASEQLIAMKLVTQEKVGKEYRMELIDKGAALYKKSENYLITPVFREMYIDSKYLPKESLSAGESALSECSMMNSPKISCYAVSKDAEGISKLVPVDIRWENCESPVKLQLWKYDPRLFKKEDRVDTVSLICSLKDIGDERIDGEIEEIIEEERW